ALGILESPPAPQVRGCAGRWRWRRAGCARRARPGSTARLRAVPRESRDRARLARFPPFYSSFCLIWADCLRNYNSTPKKKPAIFLQFVAALPLKQSRSWRSEAIMRIGVPTEIKSNEFRI